MSMRPISHVLFVTTGLLVTAAAPLVRGDAAPAPSAPVVGSSNTVTAEPPIARPRTAPCVAPLFQGVRFADFAPKPFAYTPPPGCAGPWSKIVFEGDFAVSAGRQFDRTANVWIGGVNVFFGTTPEPSASAGRTWHVERDLTEYAPLFASAQAGEIDLGNLVDATYTGVITGSAVLKLYPRARGERSGAADVVLPLSAGPTGGAVALETSASALARTFTLPTNVERAYLDVLAQSQGGDEFWYTCVPDALAAQLQSCGGASFRETEVAIDGAPAGVAPVYPWIYTGGIDPLLWRPIPGVQTLDLAPYRVDLTPFAARLSDGAPHTISLSVAGANHHFAATATLLLHLDHGRARVRGGLLSSTVGAAPTPAITNGLHTAADGSIAGTVSVDATRSFVVAGYVDTSHGRVETEVRQRIDFSNAQTFAVDAKTYAQDVAQTTRVVSFTTTRARGAERVILASREWPLRVKMTAATAADGSSTQTTTIAQGDLAGELETVDGFPRRYRVVSNRVEPTDTLRIDASGKLVGSTGAGSVQRYFEASSDGGCYSRELTATAGALSAVKDGAGCR